MNLTIGPHIDWILLQNARIGACQILFQVHIASGHSVLPWVRGNSSNFHVHLWRKIFDFVTQRNIKTRVIIIVLIPNWTA
jgi:hypothetical protein